jgi:hypothetical protein
MIHLPKTLKYGGAVLTAGVRILAAPRAAHALAATLAQVVNTTANPAPNEGVAPMEMARRRVALRLLHRQPVIWKTVQSPSAQSRCMK